jgi:hypothetical protein
MAVATISLAAGGRLAADAGALMREPIPWRSRDLSPTNLAALLAAHLGERTAADEAERILRDLGAIVNRSRDTLYATAPAGRRALGSSPGGRSQARLTRPRIASSAWKSAISRASNTS